MNHPAAANSAQPRSSGRGAIPAKIGERTEPVRPDRPRGAECRRALKPELIDPPGADEVVDDRQPLGSRLANPDHEGRRELAGPLRMRAEGPCEW